MFYGGDEVRLTGREQQAEFRNLQSTTTQEV